MTPRRKREFPMRALLRSAPERADLPKLVRVGRPARAVAASRQGQAALAVARNLPESARAVARAWIPRAQQAGKQVRLAKVVHPVPEH